MAPRMTEYETCKRANVQASSSNDRSQESNDLVPLLELQPMQHSAMLSIVTNETSLMMCSHDRSPARGPEKSSLKGLLQ